MKKFIFAIIFILNFTGLSEAQTSRRIQSSDITGALGYTPVQSIGGMTGVISCGTGLTCSSQSITFNSFPVSSLSGLGTGVSTALGVNVGSAGAFTVNGGALGTPASGVATNLTGTAAGLTAGAASTAPVSGITGAGAGCVTWLATPTSSNLRGCITDESGTGLAYFQGGDLGIPSAGVGTNLTSLNATQLISGTVPAARTNGHQNGTATNDSAATGEIGEILSNSATPALTTATPANCGQISLTAGDWDVYATAIFSGTGSTVTSDVRLGINTVSATLPAIAPFSFFEFRNAAGITDFYYVPTVGPFRVTITSTTTYYCVSQATFTTSTFQAQGGIRARRIR